MAEPNATPEGVGDLEWRPVLSALSLVAGPVATALHSQQIDAEQVFVTEIDPELADTAAFCETYGSPLENSANCVVVAGRRADVASTAGCLVLATDRADVNRTIRKHLGVRKISFASMEDAVAETGMEFGGITPIGLPADWPLLIDTAVTRRRWIVIGSGLRASKLAIPGEVATRLTAAEILDLTLPPA